MSDEPILIPCEGSGCPTHFYAQRAGMCQMCGRIVHADADGKALSHQRDDVLARIDRGDFDE